MSPCLILGDNLIASLQLTETCGIFKCRLIMRLYSQLKVADRAYEL